MTGKSSWSASVARSRKRSCVSSITSSQRAAGPVDLVDDHDRAQTQRQRPLQHGARLRHRPFDGVDQQQAAIGHVEHALDLAAEIGVAGRVDDVDLDARGR